MQKIVGVKRNEDKNIYYFLQDEEYAVGEKLVVDFDDFQTVAMVSKTGVAVDKRKVDELKKVIRKATEDDMKKYEQLKEKAKGFLPKIKSKSLELGLMMKFVGAEYSLDGSKIMIVFSSEERVDFRLFLKELATMLKTRIELKQIGQRDEIKISGGVGPCGQPCCCARFLEDFEHVTVKMAKVQGLSLSPTKINGICGRLMCCLGYESQTYEEVLSRMPKVGSEVVGPKGKGVVVYNDILRERVSIKRQAEGDTFVVEDFSLEELGEKKKDKIENKKELEKHADKEQVFENKQNQDKTESATNQKQSSENVSNNGDVMKKEMHGFRHKRFKNKNRQKSE